MELQKTPHSRVDNLKRYREAQLTSLDEIPEYEDLILDQLATGKTAKQIVDDLGWDPGALYRYGEKNLSFRERMHRARVAGMHSLVDQLQTIPDQEPDTNKARLKCENIRWVASRLDRATYGDKVDVTMTHSIDLDKAMSEAALRVADKRRQLLEFTEQTVEAELIQDEPEGSIFD